MAYCRGDILPDTCHTCVDISIQEILEVCPNQHEAIGWYDYCILRYSNHYIFGNLETIPFFNWSSLTPVNNSNQFSQEVEGLLDGLKTQATRNSSVRNYASGETNSTHALVQCSPDLSGLECGVCLDLAIKDALNCCGGDTGGQVHMPSCGLRFESYSFYNSTPDVLEPPNVPPSSNSTNTTGNKSIPHTMFMITTIILGVTTIILAVFCSIFITIFCIQRAKKKVRSQVETPGNADNVPSVESLWFDFAIIRDGTDGFSPANMLGEGAFGPVFKGTHEGREIAVKMLSGNSNQGEQEFKTEILLLAKLEHCNLVKLIGFGLEGTQRLLIYEFMKNKSLDDFLSDTAKCATLEWRKRKRIIKGIARGLLYLQKGTRNQIIHLDLKPGNILLDSEMSPKISDFGTARLFVVDRTHCTTNIVKGTIGYMAPEYFDYGHFSVKSDVFSFGVLLLEIIRGQKSSRFYEEKGESLRSYAWRCWRNNATLDIVDETLRGHRSEIARCIQIGLLCAQENAADRPTMDSVVDMLTTSSLTLSLPSEPANFAPERVDRDILLRQLGSSSVEAENSASQSGRWSANELTNTELYAR